jgi:energy-coupling factor transporter ATP-binding protein EcfA2
MEKFVQIERVGQTFDTKKGKFVALRDIDLTIRQGEFVALIGHSGCGKSTLLNLIAGLTKPTDRRADLRRPRNRRPRPGARGGLPEPQPAALADLLRERLPRRRARLRHQGRQGQAQGAHRRRASNWSAWTTRRTSIRTKSPAA